MERFDEGGRTTAKFNWSRSAFASAASKVSTQNIQPTAAAVPRPLPDDKVAATLAVDPELGAGLEVEFVEGQGYRVESIRPSPGQPSMRMGDLLVSVNGRSLALTNEDDADEVLANELRHGVPLILQRPAGDEPVEPMAPESSMVPEASKLAAPAADRPEEAPAPRSLAGLLNSLFGAPDSTGVGRDADREEPGGEWPGSRPSDQEDDNDDIEVVAPAWPEVEQQEQQATLPPLAEDEEEEEVMVFQSSPPDPSVEGPDVDDVELDKPREESMKRSQLQPEVGEDTQQEALLSESEGLKVQEVPEKKDPPAERSPPRSTVRCKVPDLEDWLQELCLEEYVDAAAKWCAEMGAVSLEEIAENIEDFGADVSLKPIERQRVQKWAAQKLQGAVPLRTLALEEPSRPSRGVPRGTVPQRSLPALWNEAPEWDEPSWNQQAAARENPVYTARSVRLAVDAQGNTGLDLRFDEDWGIRVQSVDPLPGQPGLAEGDFIVAIDGCSLRHRSHEECDQVFSEHLQNGAILSVVRCSAPRESHTMLAQTAGYSRKTDLVPNWRLPRPDFRNSPGWSRQRRSGHDANRMWNRFSHRPPW